MIQDFPQSSSNMPAEKITIFQVIKRESNAKFTSWNTKNEAPFLLSVG